MYIKSVNILLRITTGWTFSRALYVVVGILLITQSIMDNLWFGTLIGAYFTSMGLFAFGCASPNGCYEGNCDTSDNEGGKSSKSEQL